VKDEEEVLMTTESDTTLFPTCLSEVHTIWPDLEKHHSPLDTQNKLPDGMTDSSLVLKKQANFW
jgi:hypothetical protein